MKVVILAGGYGTRLSEETTFCPKPMVEIGGKPILWHIMKIYSAHGFNDFIILLGYKGYYIKEYFANYFLHQSDLSFDMLTGKMKVHNNFSEPWKVTLIDTGLDTMTGGRLKRIKKYIGEEPFMFTYGDGVSDINIKNLVHFHKSHGKLVTMTAIRPEGRFGSINVMNDKVTQFVEKPCGDGNWVNGGFFICESDVLNYIKGDTTSFEQEPLQNLTRDGELFAFKHRGFWKCMDTLRDKKQLEELYHNNSAKWVVWK